MSPCLPHSAERTLWACLTWPNAGPARRYWRSGQVSQPDLFVGRLVGGREPIEWEEFGILCYWIVDLDARTVDIWHPEDERPEVVDGILKWQPDPAISPLAIALPAYFRHVWGEAEVPRRLR